jgi:serine/threonine protein kinase/predicted ATPase
MFPGPERVHPPPGEDPALLKDAVKRFDDAWRQGHRPAIDDYLPADEGRRYPLLIELVHIDLELRLKAGEPARVEEYLARYPQLAGDPDAAVDLIAAEHELRRRGEPDLTTAEYRKRFPQYVAEWTEPGIASCDTPRRRADAPQGAPTAVPGYEILEQLGRGGMGVVYKARQLSLNRLVALKFLPEECARDPLWLERFWREAVTASALNHPHICTIYGTGEWGGRPFLSMELIDGQTLTALVGQALSTEELARLFGQAALALAAAHAEGVVHRDVKPANLMVRSDGILKVLDFGLARRLPGDAAAAPPRIGRGTEPGTRVGTVLYMSPEQARAEPVDTASDIFSLGLVLYELATGRHPFLADSEIGVLHAITAQAPVPPGRLNPQLSAALAGLIEQMLAKDTRLRPTAREVAAALADLTGKRAHPKTSPSASPRRPLLVGRSREHEVLAQGFASAAAGQGLLLCVTGQPGLGKSSLVESFLEALPAGDQACSIGRGRCSERLGEAEAYLPILEALDDLLQSDREASAGRLLKAVAPTWYVQVAPRTGDACPERLVEDVQSSSQERMKRELIAFFQEVSRLRPLVLFLDDVHWADAATVDLLAYLGPRCRALRLLLVVTYRPTELLLSKHAFMPVQLELQHAGVCREVPLGLLSRAEVETYLALAFAGHGFPGEFVDLLHGRTEGNPLFLVDLLRYLRDRGIIASGPEGWVLTQAGPDFERALPESVRSMIRKKLALLSKADLRLLSAASVQGNEFDSAVVARVLEREAADVEESLAVLARVHGVVHPRQEQEFPDGTLTVRCQFVHVLYQNTLYTALQPSRRTAWSAAVARALLAHYGDQVGTAASELALLLEVAREPALAIDYFLLAAGNAVRVFAHAQAAELARRGLALLPKLSDTPARARQELALLLSLGVSLVATQGFAAPEVEQTYLRARELCQRAEELPTLFPVLYGLWNMYLVRGELPRCLELATQMDALAENQTDHVFRLVAHNVLQQPLFHRGDLTAARRHQEQGLALYDAHQHRALTAVYGEDPGVGCLVYSAATLWHLGYPEQAIQSARAARRLADEVGGPFNVAQALYYGAFTRACRREARRVQELAAALMELCREQDFALLLAGGMVLHGWSLTEQDRAEEGIAQMREGLAAWHATGALSHRPYHLALLGEALGKEGRIAEGLAALAEAQTLSRATEERFAEAELYRLRGELLWHRAAQDATSRPATAEAEASFQAAIAVARRQAAMSLELRALLRWSRLLRDAGREEVTQPALLNIYGWFTEGWDAPDQCEARAFLEGSA